MTSLARAYAAELATKARSNRNVSPDGRIKVRMTQVGYQAADVKESVTAGYHTLAEAFSGWG